MKIAILTLNLNANYGGLLQCYALQTLLKHMGHEVKVLSAPRYKLIYYFLYPISCLKRLIRKIIQRKNIEIFRPEHRIINENIYAFIDNKIDIIICRKWNKRLAEKFDAIIVGSDQVWRPEFTPKIERFFLDFAKKSSVKRIAYAASFGTDNPHYTIKQMRNCSQLLKKFDFISVREISGIDLCYKYFGVSASLMPDPTLLLDREDYLKLIEDDSVTEPIGDLLVYFLDTTDEKIAILEDLVKDTDLLPFYVKAKDEKEDISIEKRIHPSVSQWLKGFQHAKFVITDSFHGCVFSIIFNKPFIAIGNMERGLSRFITLLEQFNLQDRLILDLNEFKMKKDYLLSDIDYDVISSLYLSQKEKALLFLKNELN